MDPLKNQKASDLLEAQAHLYKHILNYINSMALICAVQLSIPDKIHNHGKAMTLTELISALNLKQDKTSHMNRLMRVLEHSGFFVTTTQDHDDDQEEKAYALTPSSMLLVKDNPNSLSPFVLSLLSADIVDPWHGLGDWFRGDENITAFERGHGMSFCDSRMMNLVIRDCKGIFEGVDSVVDVGGGNGSLARIIAEAFPRMDCTVLELPQVIADSKSCKNLRFVGGDMFQHIPSADAIILKLILHGWSDGECKKILKNYRGAISGKGEAGKVIIIDVVINEKNDEPELTETKLLFDMLMMVVTTGRERTAEEWENLGFESGFRHCNITPILGLRLLIELYP